MPGYWRVNKRPSASADSASTWAIYHVSAPSLRAAGSSDARSARATWGAAATAVTAASIWRREIKRFMWCLRSATTSAAKRVAPLFDHLRYALGDFVGRQAQQLQIGQAPGAGQQRR